ncbi:DUF4389 domain-containing protein [Amycolatopsis sp. ATCC 39116]|uniref:DUF4389 domain-containing protein n=1 Tax=Amycolatopsis sp. (strain ATCC 39116 / 75iv2) TaxID=385957 RepID=UPI000364A609|nr:DUF4389 domain-containing protein [Amycolatopsis sp. ATCC 39116]
MDVRMTYPVRVEGNLDAGLSRWLWLVKWLLVIPHLVVLSFLWLAFFVLTVVAFFAILVTGRYPRAIFDFNVGVLRWSWRVQFYSYSALGTDAYPPFTLADVPAYPARLEIDYPERLSRGLVLVKWWLLAIPHYIIAGLFAGGGTWLIGYTDDDGFTWAAGGLVGILVLVAGIVLLFSGRYPKPVFDFVLGMDRWVLRVAAYAALMTDAYPPFRLDMGAHDPAGPVTEPSSPEHWQPANHRWTGGKVASVITGAVLALTATGLLTGGSTLLWADRAQRDSDGYLSASNSLSATGYAIATEDIELAGTAADWSGIQRLVGDVRVRATAADPATPVFVGIAPSAAAAGFLAGAQYATVTDWSTDRFVVHPGNRTLPAPETAGIWTAQASGGGTQTVVWPMRSGDWTVVVMNADGSPGVNVVAEIGATVPALDDIAWIVIGVGLALLAGGVALIAVPVHRAAQRPVSAQTES